MGRLAKTVLILLVLAAALAGCSSSRKSYNEKKGLMLLENTQLERNKVYNSRHSKKTKRNATRKYKKNSRYKW